MFEQSIAAKPNYKAFSNLGALYYIDGRYEDSAEALNKALELNDASYVTWTNLGNAYYWIPGKRSEAVAVFRRCAEMAEENRKVNPNDEYVLADLAAFYAMLGDEQLARSLIDKVLSIAGDNLNIMYQVGHAYEQLGERDKALGYVAEAVAAGYPAAEIEGDPFMQELTEDVRFKRLVEEVGE
jgi:serine/threonine-protein kinase